MEKEEIEEKIKETQQELAKLKTLRLTTSRKLLIQKLQQRIDNLIWKLNTL